MALTILVDTGLIYMEIMGSQYMWERGRGTADWIEVRLDRSLMSALGWQYFQRQGTIM